MVIKALTIQSAELQTVWKEVHKKVKACKAHSVKPQKTSAGLV